MNRTVPVARPAWPLRNMCPHRRTIPMLLRQATTQALT
jgi:hypothetical protein